MTSKDFLIYKVQKGDDIFSIAKRLQIHPVDLKSFHNGLCSPVEELLFDSLNGVDYIFVPVGNKNESLEYNERLNERPTFNFTSSFYKKNYCVSQSSQEFNQETTIVQSEIELDLKKTISLENCLNFSQSNFKLNNKALETKIELLSLAVLEVVYPIELILDEKGVFKRIENTENILNRLKQNNSIIEESFEGEITANYLDKITYNLTQSSYLFHSFESSLLFQTLFLNKRIFLSEAFKKYFFLVPNSFGILCECEVVYNHDYDDFVQTIIKGKSIENYTLEEVLNGVKNDETEKDSSFYATIYFEYKTDKKNKQLLWAKGEFILFEDEEFYKKFQLILE